VSLVVHLPEDLAARVEAAAAQRGVSAAEVVAEAVAAHLPADDTDPLEAFIGSGASGRGNLGRRHREIRAELTGGAAARDL
jgi:ribbon-helix-helix CopG family protein